MAYKCISVLVVLAIAAASQAEPARFRSRSSRLQFARQEEAPIDQSEDIAPSADAAAPYPAAGVTPETPFDLPTETEAQPDLTYGPPDNTYGPPDNTYGPPDATVDQDQAPAVEDVAPVDDSTAFDATNGRLRLRSRRPQPAKLRAVEFIRSKPVLVYSL